MFFSVLNFTEESVAPVHNFYITVSSLAPRTSFLAQTFDV